MVHHSLCVATQKFAFLKVKDRKILIYVVCRLHTDKTESRIELNRCQLQNITVVTLREPSAAADHAVLHVLQFLLFN